MSLVRTFETCKPAHICAATPVRGTVPRGLWPQQGCETGPQWAAKRTTTVAKRVRSCGARTWSTPCTRALLGCCIRRQGALMWEPLSVASLSVQAGMPLVENGHAKRRPLLCSQRVGTVGSNSPRLGSKQLQARLGEYASQAASFVLVPSRARSTDS